MSNKSMWNSFRDGQKYMTEWPIRKELAPMFPENRVIRATQFATKVMPAVAVMSVLMQMAFNNYAGLPQAMIMALFALSMPLQGMWWLGRRRDTQLPPALAGWYRELHEKIVSEGGAIQPIKSRPRYKELAQTLNRAFKQLDKSSLERWF
ncbi:terminus macrodomain insulation protein YfbV [Enterovibrio sp. 27052020O]|uniref:terminus macrodomain insulation protein YfbV n=1 Tax=Enterovibrio sp. 27052020O TaxID=3241166 RepID=UPI0038910671